MRLEEGLELLGTYANELTDSIGTGRWFDIMLQNIVPLPLSVQSRLGVQTQPSPAKDNPLPFLQ